jgi:ABC-type Zn2+ transport system substrate-binding protein/surface adhesin
MGGRRDQHTHTHTHSHQHEQQHQHQHQHQGAVQRPESYVRVDSFIASPPGTPKETMARREKRVSRFREELDFGDA